MEGMVNVKWHGQNYLHLKWHVIDSWLTTPGLYDSIISYVMSSLSVFLRNKHMTNYKKKICMVFMRNKILSVIFYHLFILPQYRTYNLHK